VVNLATTAPVSGTYHVADAGGLLWSLQPSSPSEHGSQFYVGRDFTVDVQVSEGGAVVAHGTMIRSTIAAGETSEEFTMKSAGFVGTLLMPAHVPASRALIVALGGSAGGEPLLPASALAAQGIPTLAVAYFGEPGLPSCLCDIPLEYFDHVLKWVKDRPETRGRPVVLLGSSRGAEAALLVADTYPHDLDALALGSPTDTVHDHFGGSGSAWTVGGEMIPTGEVIPVDAITVPVMIGAGGRDAVWDSASSAASIMSRLPPVSNGSALGHVNLTYPAAGHMFVAPPFIPYVVAGEGGTEFGNQLALQAFWPRLATFAESA
jgi:dienelactone hydrolase